MPAPDLSIIRTLPILVVEDNQDTVEIIRAVVQEAGYRHVQVAADVQEARKRLAEAAEAREPIELVLLDLMLPEVDGYTLCQEIRAKSDIPILVVTAKSDLEDELKSLRLGATDYIRKPFSHEILLLKVEKSLTQHYLSRHLAASLRRNQQFFLNTVKMMAKAMETKAGQSASHGENVARYAQTIALKCSFTTEMIERLMIAGMLHDFGKIGIDSNILNKEGHLSDEEYTTLQKHPMIACNILEPLSEFNLSLDDILYHHEHFDGGGYPEGIAGEEIPLGARILAVAEAFDCMTSPQPYRRTPFTKEAAKAELLKQAGKQFDPKLVELFVQVLENG